MCYLHVKNKKKNHFLAFLAWFLLFGKIQDGSLDDNHVWWRYRPAARPPPMSIPYLVEKIKGFPLEDKIVSKYCSILKTWWTGVPSTPPPLNHGGGMTFSCTSEGIKSDQRVWETSRWKNVTKAWAYAAKSHSTSTREYIGAKTVMHDIPCTFRKVFYHWI